MISINTTPKTKSLKTLKIYYALIVLFAIETHAETPLPLTASQLSSRDIVGPYITSALQHNPALLAAEKRYEAARQSIEFAGALPNPRFQLTHFVEAIQTRTGPQRQALSLQQPIPWPGTQDRKRQIARTQSEALWHAYANQQFMLIDEISKQALEVAFLDRAIEITRKNTVLLNRLEQIVEEKVKAGADLSDLLRLQLEIQRFEDTLAKQQSLRRQNQALLQSLIGQNTAKKIPSASWQAPTAIAASSQQWLDAIPDRSPQIAMLRALAQSLESRERLAQFTSKPDFTVGLNYLRTGDALNPSTAGSGNDPWALLVGVSLPIWSKANNAISLQAALEKDAIDAEIQNLELTLHAQGNSLIEKLHDSQDRIQRYEANSLPLARQTRAITTSSYQSGKATILDLIDSERTLLQLETEYWRTAADAWRTRWALTTLSGGLWLE